MNGSRSNSPRNGNQAHGGGTSLDALNRTIEGLEARIEGLMGGASGRDQRGRTVEREPAQARPDPIAEIMQRQRTLTASRERDVVRERVLSRSDRDRAETQPLYSDPRSAPMPSSRTPVSPGRYASAQPPVETPRNEPFRAAEPARQPAQREPVRPSYLRQDPPREAVRTEIRHPEPVRPDPAIAEIAGALVGLRQELKRDIADGLSREMNALRAEIKGIKTEASQDHTVADEIRGDLQKLAESIGQLGRQASPSQAEALKVEFDELRVMIDGLAREDSVRRMETRWSGVEDRMNASDNSRDDELVALAYRLDEIKSQISSINNGPALHAMEDKLVSVAQALEAIGRHMQPDDQQMASQFADLDARLDEISRAIVASGRNNVPDMTGVTRVEGRLADMARQLDTLQKPADNSGMTRMESRLTDLSRQIDTLKQPTDNGLATRIEALAARIEELANEETAVRLEERIDQLSLMMERAYETQAQPDLTGYLADISSKIDALDQGAVNDALAERLDDLARRIDQLDMPQAGGFENERFDRLEGQLSSIAERLEETHAAPFDDSEILRSLQDQIANLSSLVSAPRESAPVAMPAEFEGRMSALEEYMATSDEYIIEAARQAAEAVMEAYTKNGGANVVAGGTDMAAISALADDLKVLEELSRSSEDRTARTFEALHETLVHIAEKLERLEDQGVTHAEEPRAFGTRGRDDAPQMPRAQQPAFVAAHEDNFNDEAFDRHFETLKRDVDTLVAEQARVMPAQEERQDEAELVSSDPVEPQAEVKPATVPAKTGLLAGLTKRFKGKRTEPARDSDRTLVEPTPPIDAVEAIEPHMANQLLEPGSGVPDVKKILERVRAGQAGRNTPPSEADKADFIAAARRAAQQAAEETDTLNKGKSKLRSGVSASPATGGFSRYRRPVLMAVGAVLLAIMSYPLVNTLIRGDRTPVEAPVAAIEQQQAPATAEVAPAAGQEAMPPVGAQADEPADSVEAPLNAGQQSADIKPEATDAQPMQAMPTDDGQPMKLTTQPAEGQVNARMLTPELEGSDNAAFDEAPATQTAASAANVVVPDAIKTQALADAARKGDPMALFEIGAVYTEGRGVKADLAEAAKWYQKASDAGVVPAEYRLASLYEKGTGVPRDLPKARALYEDAANKGNASAMHNLAVLLAGGALGQPDFTTAVKWFTMAADRGVRDSQFNLAILYARGNGVAQDLGQSYKWFAIAANDGDTDAAQKRDEVAKALGAEQLTQAKALFDGWKITPPDEKANSIAVPDSWVGKAVNTSSVDMKKAVRNIQAILNNNGFDAGKPDGEMGQKTVSAIKAFQKSIGQEPTGQITDALVKELLKRNG